MRTGRFVVLLTGPKRPPQITPRERDRIVRANLATWANPLHSPEAVKPPDRPREAGSLRSAPTELPIGVTGFEPATSASRTNAGDTPKSSEFPLPIESTPHSDVLQTFALNRVSERPIAVSRGAIR